MRSKRQNKMYTSTGYKAIRAQIVRDVEYVLASFAIENEKQMISQQTALDMMGEVSEIVDEYCPVGKIAQLKAEEERAARDVQLEGPFYVFADSPKVALDIVSNGGVVMKTVHSSRMLRVAQREGVTVDTYEYARGAAGRKASRSPSGIWYTSATPAGVNKFSQSRVEIPSIVVKANSLTYMYYLERGQSDRFKVLPHEITKYVNG